MIQISHIAIWTQNLEQLREFYEKFFEGESNEKYVNPKKGFESYFITFNSGARIEIMRSTSLEKADNPKDMAQGYAHIAFSLGSKEAVNKYTERFLEAGYPLVDGPRTTGDGYYESVIKDPDGNLVELTV